MPLILEGGRVPPRWAMHEKCRQSSCSGVDHLTIALINNMPDAALEDTELQFFALLDDASANMPVFLKLYSLTGVPRAERGQRHLDSFYHGLNELWSSHFDGVIITGTEPRQPNLPEEPYWPFLTQVFDWAERNTASTICSCLAAHASVLYGDGVPRHRLSDKQFGVFNFIRKPYHHLVHGMADRVRFPHSRWNEVRAEELTNCGYTILTYSSDGGVDTFAKKKHDSLFLFFQGHPEYGADTLLKEYRRDIRRFVQNERDTYPTMPKGYFDADSERLMTDFREMVLRDPREALMEAFPDAVLANALKRTWEPSATSVYRNWLSYLTSAKEQISAVSPVVVAYEKALRKRSALG